MTTISGIVRLGATGANGAGISTAQLAALLMDADAMCDIVTADAASTSSTNSKTTYADALVATVPLPGGSTWTVWALAIVRLRNDASNTSDMRCTINSTAQPVVTTTLGPNAIDNGTLMSGGSKTGITGANPTVRCQFKSNGGGVTYANNPAILWIAKKTA